MLYIVAGAMGFVGIGVWLIYEGVFTPSFCESGLNKCPAIPDNGTWCATLPCSPNSCVNLTESSVVCEDAVQGVFGMLLSAGVVLLLMGAAVLLAFTCVWIRQRILHARNKILFLVGSEEEQEISLGNLQPEGSAVIIHPMPR